MLRNMVEPGRPQMTMWRLWISRWVPKTTNAHLEYVIHIAFPGNNHCTNITFSIHCCLVGLCNFYARSRKLRKTTISFGISVCLSVRLQLDGFLLYLTLYMKTYILLHF